MSESLGTDPFITMTQNAIKKNQKKLDSTKGIRAKSELLSEIYSDTLLEYFQQIQTIDSETFDKLCGKRYDVLMDYVKTIPEKLGQTNLEGTSHEELSALSLVLEPDQKFLETIVEKLDEMDLGIEAYTKLFRTEFISKFEYYFIIVSLALELMPLFRLGDVVKKRFNSDYNWGLAVAMLATQENLVKKKLIDLGMTKSDIRQFLKNNSFAKLVDLLAEKIKEKEKRHMKISFYKPSSLRDVRNKIEHEGYEVKVEADDILDLIEDVEKFDKELFPDKEKI